MVIISNEKITVAIDSLGGELKSVKDNKTGHEYLWQGDPAYWGRSAINLFPFIGRLYGEKYTYKGVTYDMTRHGFLPRAEMKVVQEEKDACTFELEDSEETYAIYPFHFVFQIRYQLEDNQIRIVFHVKNKSKEEMYCAMGGHPGFNLPMDEGLSFEDYIVEFSQNCSPSAVEWSDSILWTGNQMPYTLEEGKCFPLKHDLFSLDCIVLTDIPRSVSVYSKKGKRKIQVDFPQMPYLGFWHKPRVEAPYLCIEPWSCLPGREGVMEDLETMKDMTKVSGEDSHSIEWSITVE